MEGREGRPVAEAEQVQTTTADLKTGPGPTCTVSRLPREGQHSGRPAPQLPDGQPPLPTIYRREQARPKTALTKVPGLSVICRPAAGCSSARAQRGGVHAEQHSHAGCPHRALGEANATRGAHTRRTDCGQLQTPRGARTPSTRVHRVGAGPDSCCGGPSDEPSPGLGGGHRAVPRPCERLAYATPNPATEPRAPRVGDVQPRPPGCGPAPTSRPRPLRRSPDRHGSPRHTRARRSHAHHRPRGSPDHVAPRPVTSRARPSHCPLPPPPPGAASFLTSSNRLLTQTPSFPAPRGCRPPGPRFGPSSSASSSSWRTNCRAPGPRGSWPRCSPLSLRRARRDIGPNGR